MSQNIIVKERAGRQWSDNGSIKRKFIIYGLEVGFNPSFTYVGLPNVGDVHPSFPGYKCVSRDFKEGESADKTTVSVDVNYELFTAETSGSGEDEISCQVVEWGWSEGADQKELTVDADGVPVLNSAGDPFDTVPSYNIPAPEFVKVMKFKDRQSGWFNCNCKVNNSPVTISGITFPIGTLLCSVSEKRIIGDENWKYEYTVRLKYKTNSVKIEGNSSETEIGWDVAILDAGMRALQTVGDEEKKTIIRMLDPETRVPCVVTTAAALDGNGHVRSETDNSEPYCFRFKVYKRVSIPTWFYSEPTAIEEGLD